MTDDEDDRDGQKVTPELRRLTRYSMPELERDGRAHQRAVTENERRRHAELYASGVPAVAPAPEDLDTGPVAMMEAVDLDADDFQQMHRLRRVSPDPYVGMYKLSKLNRQLRHELRELRQEERSNNQERANQLLELLNRPPHEDVAGLRHDVATLKETVDEMRPQLVDLAPVRGGLKWLTGSFVAVAVAICCWFYARGGKETAIDMRLQALETSVGELHQTLQRLLERREGHP